MFKPLAKLLKALSSNTDPGAIACAFACGLILGFIPKGNLIWWVLFVFMLFMRIQRGAFALAIFLGSLLAPRLDPTFISIGDKVLHLPQFIPYYIKLLDTPFVVFTKFNNTVVMGSLIVSVISFIPVYIIVRILIFVWRRYIGNAMRKLKFLQNIKQIPLIEKIVDAVEEA